MACDNIRARIRPFLEDLLDENEHQDVRTHLEECADCRTYAASIGTLTYQLNELGAVKAPHDLIPTILYELKQPIKPAAAALKNEEVTDIASSEAESLASQGRPFLIWLLMAAFVCSAIFLGIFYFEHSKNKIPDREQNILQTSTTTSSLNAPSFASQGATETDTSMEKIKTIVYGDEADKTSAGEKIEQLKAFVAETKKGPRSLSEWRPMHWHYHVSSSSQSELFQVIHALGLAIDYESSNFFIVYVPKLKLEELVRRLGVINGVITEFNVSNIESIMDESIQVSFYLT